MYYPYINRHPYPLCHPIMYFSYINWYPYPLWDPVMYYPYIYPQNPCSRICKSTTTKNGKICWLTDCKAGCDNGCYTICYYKCPRDVVSA